MPGRRIAGALLAAAIAALAVSISVADDGPPLSSEVRELTVRISSVAMKTLSRPAERARKGPRIVHLQGPPVTGGAGADPYTVTSQLICAKRLG